MGKEKKSKHSALKHCGTPYQQTRHEAAHRVTEEKPQLLIPLVKLYDIMSKREKKGEGASKIPGSSPETMPAGEKGCASYKEGSDLIKDPKEMLTPENSEGEGTSKK